MNVSELLGQAAAIMALVAAVPYIRSILQGRTKPNRASWLIWVMVNYSLVFSYHFSGATTTIWINMVYVITSSAVFLLSLKYGVGGYTRLDIFCLVGATLGLLLWWLTNNPVTALYLNVLMDAFGFLPTLKKGYLKPQTENKLAWTISAFANVLNVLALTTWQFRIAFFPVYNLIFNTIMAVLLYGIVQKPTRHRSSKHRLFG